MQVIFFGGTGAIGQRAVDELCKFPEIEQITVAARKRQKYERLLARIENGKKKLKLLEMDLSHEPNLAAVLQGYDLVASAAGPFYKYEYQLAEAAIEAGAHYVSICDDFDAAEEIFTLDARAREQGLHVLTGIGWTPGLSNLMARKGAASLDKVAKINVAWAGSTEDAMGVAVILHVLHIFTNRIPSFQDGSLTMVPAGSGKEIVSFPEPIGKINVYNVGHPEPVTMRRYFPDVTEITLKGGINEDLFNKLAIIVGKLGLSQSRAVRNLVAAFFQKTLPLWRKAAGPSADYSGIRVDIKGVSAGEHRHIAYSAAGPMDVLTGVPMAIAIRELARDKVQRIGVFAPEAPNALDPETFFVELGNRGVAIMREEI